MASSIGARYDRLSASRTRFLDAARRSGALTLPHLIPNVDNPEPNHWDQIELPFTDLGQQGVNTFASKLTLALMPPGENSFRYQIEEVQRLEKQRQMQSTGMDEAEIAEQMATIDAGLLALEQSTLRQIEAKNDRVRVYELTQHLVVAGNCLHYIGKDGSRNYFLNQYVLRRGAKGAPREAIIKERVRLADLPLDIKAKLQEQLPHLFTEEMWIAGNDMTADLYTEITWGEKEITWKQIIEDVEVLVGRPSPLTAPEWIAARMYHISGQDYSPGYVEVAALAGLQTANLLSQALTEGSLMAAMLRFMRKPNAACTIKEWKDSRNGDLLTGMPDDITPLQIGKAGDFRTAAEELAKIEARLRASFLMLSIRDSERTTRQEVEATVMELQQSQANVYGILTTEFLIPFIHRRLSLLGGNAKRLEGLSDLVSPVVSAGLAAVGRGVEGNKLAQFLEVARANFGEQAVAEYLNAPYAMRRLAASLNLLTPGLVKSDQQVADEREQARNDQIKLQAIQSGAANPQVLASAAATAMDAGLISPPDQGGQQDLPPQAQQ